MESYEVEVEEIERLFEDGDLDALKQLLPPLLEKKVPAAIRINASFFDADTPEEVCDQIYVEGMFEAAELNDQKARYQVGVFYDYGEYGIPQDKSKASEIFKELAEEGDPHCMWIHACELLWGRGSYPQSIEKGLEFLESAIEKGSAEACITKARLYKEQEFGFSTDEREVLRLRKLAQEYDDTTFDPYA
ncbi:MAG: SEL1-like repeat protein [Candidatus Thiodiazotropha sp. (ex Monitilora ramsayi)]|nr:SEL1-like repeat protein [Candidatus Thiodiazotropha sp. (ex Monitilora ramsayi)]